jgi:hypothetical protein
MTPSADGPLVKKKERSPAAADVLVHLARQQSELFHDPGKVAFATFGVTTTKVRSKIYRSWLAGLFYTHTKGRAANAEAMGSAINTLEAVAIHDAPEQPVHVRVAEHGGAIYLNLGDEQGSVVRIDPAGWTVGSKSPVKFLTTVNMMPLPKPERGGKIADLQAFLNCPDPDNFALLCGFLSACFLPEGPFPVLDLTGQQGSAKSTTSRILKELIDPERVRDRSTPKDLQDLAIWASGSRLLCLDNISSFPDWLSDAICRLSTGGGFGKRTLYENDEETLFYAKRPVILNGIEEYVTRPDLLDRAIVLPHPAIPEHLRRLEFDLWREFHLAKPKLLGSVLDRAAAGLKARPTVDTRAMPRMADACAFAVACEAGMREQPRFLEAFRQNQHDSHELTLADSPIVEPVLNLVKCRGGQWTGTASELYAAIKPAGEKLPDRWPKKPSGLSGKLKLLGPSLVKCRGLVVSHERLSDTNRTRVIKLTHGGEKVPDGPSGPSRSSEDTPPAPDDGTTMDDRDGTPEEFSGAESGRSGPWDGVERGKSCRTGRPDRPEPSLNGPARQNPEDNDANVPPVELPALPGEAKLNEWNEKAKRRPVRGKRRGKRPRA